jgi:cytochrome c
MWSYILLTCLLITGTQYGQERVNLRRKERDSIRLLKRGAAFLARHTVAEACHVFTDDPRWRKGELFIFVLDTEGTCYAFGDEKLRIWTNFSQFKDAVGLPLIQAFLKDRSGNKPVTVMLNNAFMYAHTMTVQKGATTFILGCGFYPQEIEYIVEDLVYRAIDVMNGIGLEDAFIAIENPYGHLVHGSSYVFVMGDDGTIYAQGDQRADIGKNIFSDPVDPVGSPAYEEKMNYRENLRRFLLGKEQQAWLPPVSFNNTLRRIFAVKYKDPKTQRRFVVGSFYYPEINDDAIYSLVEKAVGYIKVEGREVAFADINKPNGPLSLGTGRVAVYDFNGYCLANGEDAALVGHNLIDRADAQGHYTIKRLIEDVSLNGRAWISVFSKNDYKLVYAEQVDLPNGPIIVSAGYWPDTKQVTVRALINRASDYITRHGKAAALAKFSSFDSDFLRGDVKVMALDPDGLILADGPYGKHLIWSRVGLRDRFGRHVINNVLSTAAQGGGWVGYRRFNADFRVFAQGVPVPDGPGTGSSSLVVMAGYYL